MRRRPFGVFVGILFSLVFLPSAHAAFLTDVADSFDYENNRPFGFRLQLSYRLQAETAVIAREFCRVSSDPEYNRSCRVPPQGTRKPNDDRFFDYLPEFNASRTRHEMLIRPSIGLYKDLEFYLVLPIVFAENYSASVHPDANAVGGPTLLQDGVIAQSNLNNNRMESRHGVGFGDMSLGLRWAIFNDYRDRTKATWLIGFALTLPTGEVWDPKDPRTFQSSGSGAGVGRGAYVFHFETALSKRVQMFDPYVQIFYNYYLVTNDVKEGLQRGLSSGNNALVPSVRDLALAPGHHGGFLFGSEIVFWENTDRQQKLVLDLRFTLSGRFEGRDYTLFTDFLSRYNPRDGANNFIRNSLITDHEQNLSFGGQAALHFRLAKYGYIRLEGSVQHTLPFFLTYAKRGVDRNNNGYVDPGTDEEYPFHIREIDGIGRRIMQRDTLTWTFFASAAFTL